jgi:MOSC domain-containing protein YiiM
MKGLVTGIYISRDRMAPMISVGEAHAVPGRGLEGDRYFTGSGTFSDPFPNADSEVTLIEEESVEALNRDHGGTMAPSATRRNIVTKGIKLNDLAGREFTIGTVRFLGHRLCEPCDHLQRLTGEHVLPGLVGRGGLRAQVLSEGIFRLGESIETA